MTAKYYVFSIILVCVKPNLAAWYKYRVLRNPGLVTDNASSSDQCVAKCESAHGCSAVSYQMSSGVCLRSMCNNIDLYKTTGWNTYVLTSPLAERVNVPASNFEWMLTDTCGNTNQGTASGPAVSLSSVSYSPSQSLFAGNAAVFNGGSTSYGLISGDSRINNPLGNSSLSVMMWAKWTSFIYYTCLIEFAQGSTRGPIFWLAFGGVFYVVNYFTSGCTGNCHLTYNYVPTLNNWHHLAFVYDATKGQIATYLNSTQINTVSVGIVTNLITWDNMKIAYSQFFPAGQMLGSLYCYKMTNIALDDQAIAALAQSCSDGKIRFSD